MRNANSSPALTLVAGAMSNSPRSAHGRFRLKGGACALGFVWLSGSWIAGCGDGTLSGREAQPTQLEASEGGEGTSPASIPGQDTAPGGGPSACGSARTADPGPALSRRLNRTEYDNTVRALLRIDVAPAAGFPGEELAFNFDNNASALSASPVLVEEYARAADLLAASPDLDLVSLVPCDPSGGESCARTFLDQFGQRAFRRPLEPAEIERYVPLFRIGAEADFDTGIRLMLSAILQSAPFLYRVELSGAELGAGKLRPSSFEMASRLSYLLWKTMPDEALFEAARADRLQTPEQLETEARRMLEDPRARSMIADFHEQWLSLRDLDRLEKSPEIFPSFDESIARDMSTEAALFIQEVLYAEGDASRLFDADYTFVNGNLASFYGIGGVTGDAFQKVVLRSEQRAGVLTLGGVQSLLAKPNQTNPIIRGKYVRAQMLCGEMPDPPAGINIQVPELDANLTTRERFRQHSDNAVCAGCHQLMDPIGMAFESYDGVGRFRTSENGQAIDTSGEVLGTDVAGAFDGIAELGDKLAQSSDAKACLVTNWFRYAYGRDEQASTDACAVERLNEAFREANYDVAELIVALTQSDAFLYRTATNAL
jgi:Protein of unknown function (DUF1592)/Protein of unknown function (DUF1588)/Protein of unknown function (DUF1587)/Protein of unknown function (DUF1595)/Protein of unknown function (DUF1585)